MTSGILGAFAVSVLMSAAPTDSVPLYDNLGDHHRPITTSVPAAQAYFDQGLRLVYAFNHAEAIRAFDYATELDPNCAICRWGAALAWGPNINAEMSPDAGDAAYRAVLAAIDLRAHASEREQAMIDALAARYTAENPADRAALDSLYASAMIALEARYPEDDDIATWTAEARMLLTPWNYWTEDRGPRPGTEALIGSLERVLERSPDHPGACHFYIHAVEAAYPERAVPCAERLAALMPGAGHIVHMPGHVYIRVGRYADAVDANVHAVHADETFIEDQNPDGMYPAAYYPHNYHFMAFAAMMAGRAEQAIDAARKVAAKVDPAVAKEAYFLETAPAYGHLALVTFGRWDEVLAEPVPMDDLTTAIGLAHYARGIALAATGRADEARMSLAVVRSFAARRATEPENPASTILPLAVHALEGEIALRTGNADGAVTHFEIARDIEDAMQYDEPPLWYYPVRHSLGRALLEAGRAGDAEAAYREDLNRFPNNGWALYGLAESLRAQGEETAAAEVDTQLAEAWGEGAVALEASRF